MVTPVPRRPQRSSIQYMIVRGGLASLVVVIVCLFVIPNGTDINDNDSISALALPSNTIPKDRSLGDVFAIDSQTTVVVPSIAPTVSSAPTIRPDTGAFKNCHGPIQEHGFFFPQLHDHSIVVACHKIHYKVPLAMYRNRFFFIMDAVPPVKLMVGILSSATAEGKIRRDGIRHTWGKDIMFNRYFIVGGTDFSAVETEFKKNQDMIWLDLEESYEGLLYKTGAMLGIFQRHVINLDFVLKTDDDSYINVHEVQKEILTGGEGFEQEYFGHCHVNRSIPYRPAQRKRLPPYFQKFIVNKTVYPEKWNAPYCQGAGYIVGPKFLQCIGREIASVRYHPFEDVAIGLVAERCGIPVTRHSDEMEYKWKFGVGETNMTGKILQHPVETTDDMMARHRSVITPR